MKNKTTWIIVGIVLAVIFLIVGIFAGANNKAVFLEEQINGAQANINVAEKRRVDLVYNLVDAVQAYQDYEGKTLEAITAARSSVSNGDIDEAKVSINAVAEAYPELKANENYRQLMNELAMTENQIAQYRNNYNEQVRAYNKIIRSFPNNVILSILGYERIETTYTDYGAPVDAPQNLFDNGLQQIDDLRHRYGSDYVDQLLKDFSNSEPISHDKIRERFEDEFECEAGYILSYGNDGWWSDDKPTFRKKWEEAHPGATGADFYNSPERKAAIKEYVENAFKKLFNDIGSAPYLVELEYEDHTDIGSALEHDILPNCDFTVRGFSHH